MRARFQGMTLQTLLQQHGITTIKELMHRTGLSRQGKATAKRLHERLGIPAEALLQVDPVPARPRRSPATVRPRQASKRRPSTPPKEEA
jgi:hypothetical protein